MITEKWGETDGFNSVCRKLKWTATHSSLCVAPQWEREPKVLQKVSQETLVQRDWQSYPQEKPPASTSLRASCKFCPDGASSSSWVSQQWRAIPLCLSLTWYAEIGCHLERQAIVWNWTILGGLRRGHNHKPGCKRQSWETAVKTGQGHGGWQVAGGLSQALECIGKIYPIGAHLGQIPPTEMNWIWWLWPLLSGQINFWVYSQS